MSATDLAGQQADQTLSFTIEGSNDAPDPENMSFDVLKDGSLTGSEEVGSGASNGSLVFNSDGSSSYTPEAGYVGLDSFTYTVEEGSSDPMLASVIFAVQSGSGAVGGQEVSLDILPSGTISAETSAS